jgi:hypothetical protein
MLKKIRLSDVDALLLLLLVLITLLIVGNNFDDGARRVVRLAVVAFATGGVIVFLWRRSTGRHADRETRKPNQGNTQDP